MCFIFSYRKIKMKFAKELTKEVIVMKKFYVFLIIGLSLASNSVFADENIAVVDLQKIVSNSSQVKQLKQEHAKKTEELNKIIVNARGEISNQTDSAKILQLEEKYTNEFNAKKSALEKDYNARLAVIEKSIKDEIAKKAKADNYDYVFAKSVLLYGGKDITDEIKVK